MIFYEYLRHTITLLLLLITFCANAEEEDSLLQVIAQAQNDTVRARSLINLGTVYGKSGDFEKAAECLMSALDISERLKDSSKIRVCFGNLGNVFLYIGDSLQATTYFNRSLNYFNSPDLKKEKANIFLSLSVSTGDIKHNNEALKIYKSIDDSMGIAYCYNNLGISFDKEVYNDSAIHYFELSEHFWPSHIPQTIVYMNLGLCYKIKGEYQTAINYYQQGLEIKETIARDKAKIYKGMTTCYSELGKFEEAYHYQKLSGAISDSIKQAQNRQKIYSLALEHTQREFDIKQDSLKKAVLIKDKVAENRKLSVERSRNIILFLLIFFMLLVISLLVILNLYRKSRSLSGTLNKTVEELRVKRSNLELRALQATMNPHFIANSLASINYYISQNDVKSSFDFLSGLGKLMRIIFNDSMKKTVSIQREIETLRTYFFIERTRIDNKVELNISTAPSLDPGVIGIPLLILQPFIENVIWYGVREKNNGQIDLHFIIEQSELVIFIRYNGIRKVNLQEARHRRFNNTYVSYKRLQQFCKGYGINKPLEINPFMFASSAEEGTEIKLRIPLIETYPQ